MADNSSRKFKFISPGVFIDEVDNSQLPESPGLIGPLVIGKSFEGPAMTPITVNSFSDFVDTFGDPLPGNEGGDVWREGNKTAPTYGPYAAQAWLKNNSPVTYVRLVGEEHPDKSAAGKAGWLAGSMTDLTDTTKGGAYGLYVWPSASHTDVGGPEFVATTGSLACVFYIAGTSTNQSNVTTGGRLLLSGTRWDGVATASIGDIYRSNTSDPGTLTVASWTNAAARPGTGQLKYTFSLDPDRGNFVRNVLNTNPTLTNTDITNAGGQQRLWVGETYERWLTMSGSNSVGVLGSDGKTAGNKLGNTFWAALLPLVNQADASDLGNDFQFSAKKGTTGWFFSQDLSSLAASYDPANMQKLFRFESRTAGEWVQNKVKVSIANIKAPRGEFETFGTFSVLVRRLQDLDNAPVVLERWDNLDLNPASPNYIAKKIGDKYEAYDTVLKRNREYGQYATTSKYIRVVMDEEVDRGTANQACLPFGVYGPLKYRDWSWGSGSGGFQPLRNGTDAATYASGAYAQQQSIAGLGGGDDILGIGQSAVVADLGSKLVMPLTLGDTPATLNTGYSLSASCVYPAVPLRQTDAWGAPKTPQNTYWGAWVYNTDTNTTLNKGLRNCLRPRFSNVNPSDYASTSHDIAGLTSGSRGDTDLLQISWAFSLDNVSGTFDTAKNNVVVNGSGQYNVDYRTAGISMTAQSQSANGVSYKNVLDAGYDRFTTVLAGGFDGLDIIERDPFRNSAISATATEKTSYVLHTLKRAIDVVSDPDQTQYNLITMPGITNSQVTDHLLDTVEDRADALAIVDIPDVYTADTENSASAQTRNNFTTKQTTDAVLGRDINNSYGATYAPWVLIQDTISNRTLWAPPSIAALGALSTTDRKAAPWFAPAGFTRGGLSEGAGGIPILDVTRRYSSDDRDNLYEANINPIAKFPAEGIVIFGQKTLQQTRSALDRINVRRLMIYLKREISFIASRLLFAPNTRDTWTRFIGQATPLLDSVKAEFGIDDFKLILDESTTTPDLIDRNIIYSKLLVKPTRSAEFFAIDFVITNSGASFED